MASALEEAVDVSGRQEVVVFRLVHHKILGIQRATDASEYPPAIRINAES